MLVLLVYLLIIAPVELSLVWDQGLTVELRIWGLGRRWMPQSPGSRGSHANRKHLLGTLLRTDRARRFLLRHTRLVCLQALLRIGLQDAARTALVSGALQLLSRYLPGRTDIRIQPDFLSSTRLQARCILFCHLGTLLITAAMVLAAYVLEAREHLHPHPKEA